ncbi:response regulator [Spirosoma sp. KCTC 42546]|uniref:GAF domain-containing hybrid sensor histidine kinase/response regulator n=1 Tax=Spirosoma sp. KCTC 42546 TaxID=2520506 RepID=UPI001159EB3B|nr:response regulator [Spirosoma sp. KCTC 42546]QDK79744.1 response regulator [Spirosoma sp. KCTC 42546]
MTISFINKLHLGSIFLILAGSLIGILFFHTIQDQRQESRWAQGKNQQIQQIILLEKLLDDAELEHRTFLSTHNQVSMLDFSTMQEQVIDIFSKLKSEADESPRQIQQLRRLEATMQGLIQLWSNQHNSSSPEQATRSGQLTELEARQLNMSRHQLDQLLRDTQQALAQREEKMRAQIKMLTEGAVGATVILFIVALTLTYFYAQEFKRHREMADQLHANVNELEQLNLASDNRNWVLMGTTTLNEALQNLQDPDAVAKQSIKTISQYLSVPAAGFYLCYEQDDEPRLKLSASVALPATAPKSYALGENLVGQAATRREISVINDVPISYWPIQSGTGEAVAGQVVCVPLWYGNELKGVMELAFFQPSTNNHLTLLIDVASDIAIALSTVQARQRMSQLLQQVQQQKAILENQQEELRQTNEELTLQAESLQASEEELRVQEEELRQTNTELEERNEAIEITRQTLISQARELEEASRYKSEFLANMSHELRTPLNSVLILASLMAENKPNNLTDKQIEYANVIHKSGSDLLQLINDILDLSKIEAGKVDIQLEQVAVSSIVNDLQQLFSVVAEQKSVSLHTQIDEAVPATIRTDKQRLEQTIRNLLSNAFKFTPPKGSVTLSFRIEKPPLKLTNSSLAQAAQVLVISVADTGIGIPTDRQQLIFDAFQQADGSTSRKYGGTGLGLSITRELIRLLNGEVQLQSEPGKGSTFTLILPLSETDLPISISQPSNQAAAIATQPARSAEKPVSIQEQDDRHILQKDDQVMLIIEDDPIFARIVRDFARSRQYKTILATRGDEGLKLARTYKPAAIILDMQLPVVNGWSILTELKSDEALKQIPVHIISGMDDLRLPSDGALTYIQKPVSATDLEQIFTLIGTQLSGKVKKVLVQSGNFLKDDALRHVIEQRHLELDCEYVLTNDEVVQKAAEQTYDCLIVDMGHDLKHGIKELRQLRSVLMPTTMPVIIYIDDDLSPANELKLKKLSDVVIRESSQSIDRLMDELELFLYKVQEDKKKLLPQPNVELTNHKLEGRKVLLVDDDIRNIFALSTLLEQYHMHVITADNGREALEMLQQHTDTDIVLMDIMMPEMDGYEATRRIRDDLRLSQLPIIALTAKAMPGDREKVIEAGASDYIAKPVDKSQLFSLMHVWLSK